MRRQMLMFVLASVLVACGGSAVGPTPVPTAPNGYWAGDIEMVTFITGDVQTLVLTAKGGMAWFNNPDDDVVPLRGGTLYTPSFGQMDVTLDLSGGGCSEYGTGRISFGDKDGTLIVEPGGAYNGEVKWTETLPFPTTVTCGPSTVTRPAEVVFLHGFPMRGTLVNGHIIGEWTSTEGAATYTAKWDLTPR